MQMASSVATQSRDFARHFFHVVEELGRDDWVSASDAFARTIAAHPDHPYVAWLNVNRARKAGFSAAAERIRAEEFPRLERRKAGTRKNAPVFYRVWRPDMAFTLDLPYRVPPSHPLRGPADVQNGNALRRAAPEQEPRSPWRRRQSRRRTPPDGSAARCAWWQKLRAGASGLLDMITRSIARRQR
jgi:hypothetical protein